MRVEVPRQRSTKWWILLAALGATLITWCEAKERPPRPRRAPIAAPAPADDGFIEFDVLTD